MTTIKSFHDRLAKIGIDITFTSNIPWIYLSSVNNKLVLERYEGNHGFTAFWLGVRSGSTPTISDISIVFKKIRQMLCNPEEDHKIYLKQQKNYHS